MSNQKSRTLELKFDIKNKDYLIWNDQVVMSSSETDYFEKLFRKLKKINILSKNTLEIGFGLGISAKLIQKELSPNRHDIVEIDKGIYSDLLAFSHQHPSVKPILGDWRSLELSKKEYDFIFHDSYDYSGAEGWEFDSLRDDYDTFKSILKPGGYVCHPHFGDGPVRDVNGFETVILERLVVAPILMWDKTICHDAAIVLRKPIQ
ncbi:hypothetical protein PSCICF_38310 [Pseudomonas cichorii]|nr:hypothetical protein [Pseudomonas cichorii]GFM57653.1 hypothetical protein PSCICF_38310 [Pseudomonas cichorii]